MNELLSYTYLRAVRREKLSRLLLAFVILLVFSLVAGIIFMAPSYFVLLFSREEIARRLQTEELAIEKLRLKNTEENIKSINAAVKSFGSNESGRRSFSKLIIEVANAPATGVNLASFELKKNSDGLFVTTLRGKADARENLLAYIEALKNLSGFSSVNSPVSNILSSREINFSLNLVVRPDIYSYHANNL